MADTVQWRARRVPLPWWKCWFDRRLAQANVTAPNGQQYHVRIVRNLPFRDSPLERVDDYVPSAIALAVLIGANLVARGRTGWTVQILLPATKWRHARVIHAEKSHASAHVTEIAASFAERIRRGEEPWQRGTAETVWRTIKKYVRLY